MMTMLSMFSMSVMASDTDGGASGPPADATFEHLAVVPTTYAYTATELEIAIMGEGCTNWRDLYQHPTGSGWPDPSNYNWYNQDIDAPFQSLLQPAMIISVQVEIRLFDIDVGEVNEVYLNGAHIGTMTGNDDVWQWNTYNAAPGLILVGNNNIHVDVDSTHTTYVWATTVDWIKITITYEQGAVIPEVPFGTIMASATMIIALLAFVAVRKRQYIHL